MNLHEIINALEKGYDDETGEVFEIPELELALEEKVEGYHAVARYWMDIAEGAKAEAKRLNARAARFVKRTNALGDHLLEAMQRADRRKIVTKTVTASIRKGSQRVEITDESKVPDEFIKSNPEIKKAAIKLALKDGRDVPGARIATGPESLGWRS